jgi:hypothetical protein
MRQPAARSAAVLLVAALLAPVFGAGAVLADDLRDMMAGNTGLADNPDTPGPDLFAPIVWGGDIPDMPSLVVLDKPSAPVVLVAGPAPAARVDESRPPVPALVASPETSVRGPPAA